MSLEIILNIVLIVCIAVGIGFVWRLQNTLNGLNKNRAQMEKFIGDFSGSIARAQQAIRELQDTARNTGIDVEEHLVRAQGLRDELTFLVEAADKIATRLTDNASVAQSDAKFARQQREEKSPEPRQEQRPEPRTEIKRAEKPAEPQKPPVTRIEQVVTPAQPTTKTVPTWIKRAEQNAPIINAPVDTPAPVSGLQFGGKKSAQKMQEQPIGEVAEAKDQPKSAAERELLQALEKMK